MPTPIFNPALLFAASAVIASSCAKLMDYKPSQLKSLMFVVASAFTCIVAYPLVLARFIDPVIRVGYKGISYPIDYLPSSTANGSLNMLSTVKYNIFANTIGAFAGIVTAAWSAKAWHDVISQINMSDKEIQTKLDALKKLAEPLKYKGEENRKYSLEEQTLIDKRVDALELIFSEIANKKFELKPYENLMWGACIITPIIIGSISLLTLDKSYNPLAIIALGTTYYLTEKFNKQVKLPEFHSHETLVNMLDRINNKRLNDVRIE